MFKKLRQQLTGEADGAASAVDLSLPRTAYYQPRITTETPCPNCQRQLETTHAPFMVALVDQRGRTIDGFMIASDQVGRFCPNCPTVVINMSVVEAQLDEVDASLDDLPTSYGIAVLGLLDTDTVEDLQAKGKSFDNYPLIPFTSPHTDISAKQTSSRRKKTSKPKRKKRR